MTSLIKRAMKSISKRKWGRALRFAPQPEVVKGEKIGYLDAVLNGRFNVNSGEIAVGFQISAADTVVDVGCGDGGISMFAAEMGAKVIATDVSESCVRETARRLAKFKAREFETYVSDSDPLPLPDGVATKVITSEVIEHVPDPAKFLAELVRIGKPGAQYLITCPAPQSELVQKKLAPPAYWAPPNHIRIVTHEALDALVTGAGLKIESHISNSFFWAMWWVLFWAEGRDLSSPEGPIHQHWAQTWQALLATPKGDQARRALDEMMPKNQVVVARKAG